MTHSLPYPNKGSIYPGEYIPSPAIEALLSEKKPARHFAEKPLVNMDEFSDLYKIEVMVAGVQREDIFIHIHDNILSIFVANTHSEESENKMLNIHEFESKSLERHIFLPKNAETEFVSAEYRDGILRLTIPKTTEVSACKDNCIAVY